MCQHFWLKLLRGIVVLRLLVEYIQLDVCWHSAQYSPNWATLGLIRFIIFQFNAVVLFGMNQIVLQERQLFHINIIRTATNILYPFLPVSCICFV